MLATTDLPPMNLKKLHAMLTCLWGAYVTTFLGNASISHRKKRLQNKSLKKKIHLKMQFKKD